MAAKVDIFSESHAAEIANAVPVGLAIADESGALVFVNTELERMTGYDRDELLGQSVDLLLPERFRSGHSLLREGYMSSSLQRARFHWG